jgi:hypothetical protein
MVANRPENVTRSDDKRLPLRDDRDRIRTGEPGDPMMSIAEIAPAPMTLR